MVKRRVDDLPGFFTTKPANFEEKQRNREGKQALMSARVDEIREEIKDAQKAGDTSRVKRLQSQINTYQRKMDMLELENERERLALYKRELTNAEARMKTCRNGDLQLSLLHRADLLDNLTFETEMCVSELENRLGLREPAKKKAAVKVAAVRQAKSR
ncbi:MAG: hypothetical protein II942_04405 [Alphaproteobacteria bacterium]|nr:hypothetical protein [Alphaproteobacteria bacterium]